LQSNFTGKWACIFEATIARMTEIQSGDAQLRSFLNIPSSLSAAAESASLRHGLTPWLCQDAYLRALDGDQSQRVRIAYARERLQDEQQSFHLTTLSEAFEAHNMRALVIKGAALARQIYPQLGLRAKGDLDLWTPYSQLAQMRQLLSSLGYRSIPCNFGRFSQPEQSFIGQDRLNPVKIDLHWEVSSRPLLARSFTFEAIWQSSVDFGYGRLIRAPDLVDALLIAVIHRIGHHREDVRWVWLLDIDLIWRALSREQQSLAYQAAKARGVFALLNEALESTATVFATPVDFLDCPETLPPELSAMLLNPRTSMLWIDFKSMEIVDFMKLCAEHAFPPNQFMQHRFGAHPNWLRGWFHVKRWVGSMRA